METVAYLLLALAVIGALAYALYQVNARQKRLMAELTRLERLTAEVTMSAEAVLDEVDQRIQRLSQLAAELEHRTAAQLRPHTEAEAEVSAPARSPLAVLTAASAGTTTDVPTMAPTEAPTEVPTQAPAQAPSQVPPQAEEPGPAAAAAEQMPGAPDRYGDLRKAVWRLADEGRDAVEIAAALGVPRGEVLLLLNLRGKKAPR